jgi:hypothetical protein
LAFAPSSLILTNNYLPLSEELSLKTGEIMHPEIMANFQVKMRLVVDDLIRSLDDEIRSMLSMHAAEGRLSSGDTIKRTMGFICEGNTQLFQTVIGHVHAMDISYYQNIEIDIQALATSAQESYKSEAILRFKKATEQANISSLYGRMLPDIESGMAIDLAEFQNSLNAEVVKLKHSASMSPLKKWLWGFEALLLLISMLVVGMWLKDQEGNYEPVLVGLGIIVSLLPLGIKLGEYSGRT